MFSKPWFEDAIELEEVSLESDSIGLNEGRAYDDDDRETVVGATVRTASTVSALLMHLEEICFNFNIPKAAVLLRRVHREMEVELSKHRCSGQRQILLRKLWRVT